MMPENQQKENKPVEAAALRASVRSNNLLMNSRIISIFNIAFIILALPYPIMRMNGSRDADLPAFGALLIAMIMVTLLNLRITTLESSLEALKKDLKSSGNHSEDT